MAGQGTRNGQAKRWLVTGASSGIGLALARRLAGRGADLLATGRRAMDALPADFPDCRYLALDLTDPAARAALAEAAGARLDGAILNAGLGHYRPLRDEIAADIARVVATNVGAPVALARALYPALVVAGGRLGLVGSVAHRGAAGMPVYAATKGALDGFGRALASEWQDRVAVRVLHPGPTATGMSVRAGRPADWVDRLMLDPDAVADVMLAQLQGRGWRRRASFGAVLARGLAGRLRGRA
jgi:NAD(P)-dependent dehydrogenase (short-subunit alcohol dehydrogenase family)